MGCFYSRSTRRLALACLVFVVFGSWNLLMAADGKVANIVLGIHGGTGVAKADMTPELDQKLRAKLNEALEAGYHALAKQGGTSLDAVEQAIRVLEDSPLFNAGRGAVFTAEGRNELDASIMEGAEKKAGAVAGVTVVKNPITAARAVMEKSPHVLLVGRGAETFAAEKGLEIVSPVYFWYEPRWRQLEAALKESGVLKEPPALSQTTPAEKLRSVPRHEWGTVGAVAVDKQGNLAAGTSTGGMTAKRAGRVGDSPIIGAGTYADNRACAVSATGHGEFFIRYAVAHEIVARMKYGKQTVEQAAAAVVLKELKDAGGEGAVIALDAQGNFTAPFNSEGLYRGHIDRQGKAEVALYEK
jgi:L-asparaginase / beta-aspartyl-peptidase